MSLVTSSSPLGSPTSLDSEVLFNDDEDCQRDECAIELPSGFVPQKELLLQHRAPQRNGHQVIRLPSSTPISLEKDDSNSLDTVQYVETNRAVKSRDQNYCNESRDFELMMNNFADDDNDDAQQEEVLMKFLQQKADQRLNEMDYNEERLIVQERRREKMRHLYATETDEMREKRLAKAREVKRKQKEKLDKRETHEQREERLRKQRERQRRFYTRETPEQRQRRLNKVRAYQHKRKQDMRLMAN